MVIFIIIGTIIWNNPRTKLRLSNETVVNTINQTTNRTKKEDLTNIFRSGYWTSRYFQYGTWHGPHTFLLFFSHKELEVTGSGKDDVGEFSIDGTYSLCTGQLGLTKVYEKGTGNLSQNLGHTVNIQLEWNGDKCRFDGRWNVDTRYYRGQDSFELKFDR